MKTLFFAFTFVFVLAVFLLPQSAYADDHLFNAANSQGVDNRGFGNPVVGNPGDAQADPKSVPGTGDPKVGAETGHPSVDCEDLNPTAADNASFC